MSKPIGMENSTGATGMFEVIEAERKAWPYEVVCRGRCYARCNSYRDAVRVCMAMNCSNMPEETVERLRDELGYPDGYAA